MAKERERPYSAFNFLVKIGQDDGMSFKAGFQEVGGLGVEVAVQEYRPGNHRVNATMKITGTHKFGDVSLKRGACGALDIHGWLKEVREGSQTALRSVVIELQDESSAGPVMTWKLSNARPIKYTGPAFNGKGTDVAIEELVLAVEGVEFE